MTSTKQQAEKCAADLPTDFALVGMLTLIEIVYYSFQLWKEYKAGSCASQQPKAALAATAEPDGSPSPALLRKLSRHARRAAFHHGEEFDQEKSQLFTTCLLTFISSASNEEVTACCSEPVADLPTGLFI